MGGTCDCKADMQNNGFIIPEERYECSSITQEYGDLSLLRGDDLIEVVPPRRTASPKRQRSSPSVASPPASTASTNVTSVSRNIFQYSSKHRAGSHSPTKSRTPSPEKSWVSPSTTSSQINSIRSRRQEFSRSEPKILFGSRRTVLPASTPLAVIELRKRLAPDRLISGSLNEGCRVSQATSSSSANKIPLLQLPMLICYIYTEYLVSTN